MLDVSIHLTGTERPILRANDQSRTGPFVVLEFSGVSTFLKSVEQAQALSDAYASAAATLMAMTEPKTETP